MQRCLRRRAALLPCAAALLLSTVARADSLTGTTDGTAFTNGHGVSWFTSLELEYPDMPIDLGGVITADSTGVLQGVGVDEPVTPYSMTVTNPNDFDFFASLTDVDAVLYQGGSTDPVTFTFTPGNINGFGINLYSSDPLESATLAAYDAADELIGSVTVDTDLATQFVGILDNNIDIASVTLTTGNDNNYEFGTAYFTNTVPEPGTFLLIAVPLLAVFLFHRIRSSKCKPSSGPTSVRRAIRRHRARRLRPAFGGLPAGPETDERSNRICHRRRRRNNVIRRDRASARGRSWSARGCSSAH